MPVSYFLRADFQDAWESTMTQQKQERWCAGAIWQKVSCFGKKVGKETQTGLSCKPGLWHHRSFGQLWTEWLPLKILYRLHRAKYFR